ncbi:MAG TPA: flagellar hook-associated protein FlgL [Gemmatimonadales bacterium]|nr:flagellar hook-associated protein FlgL [Gemmatimonadales bacterium]
MRITDSGRYASTLRQLNTPSQALARASEQVTSGLRWSKISEDPSAGRQVMDIDSTLRSIAQYRRTISRSRERLATEENTLGQVTDILARIKELATGQGGANASTASRLATATEVAQLRGQIISLGNVQVDGEFLFAGTTTSTAPFDPTGNYTGTATARASALAPGRTEETVHTGQQLFVDTGVLSVLSDLEAALRADDGAAIRGTISGIDAAFDGVQTNLAEIGARDRSLDNLEASFDNREDAMSARRRDLAEIPLEEATLNLTAAQTALQAAYLVTSRLQSLSLTEYLR